MIISGREGEEVKMIFENGYERNNPYFKALFDFLYPNKKITNWREEME